MWAVFDSNNIWTSNQSKDNFVTLEGYLAQQEPLQNLRKLFNNASIHKN